MNDDILSNRLRLVPTLILLSCTLLVALTCVFIKTIGLNAINQVSDQIGVVQFDWTKVERNKANLVVRNYVLIPILVQAILAFVGIAFYLFKATTQSSKSVSVLLICGALMTALIFSCVPHLFELVD